VACELLFRKPHVHRLRDTQNENLTTNCRPVPSVNSIGWTGGASPFVQVVLGGAHAAGIMAPGNFDIPGSSNSFAMAAGSGIDLELSHRFELRMIQTEYYYTRFANEVNDHQNNLRVGSEIVVRFATDSRTRFNKEEGFILIL
jgi:hypothetical protein